jgi:ubiquitin carboxyl-terminal hydrolase 26/29/37
MEKLNKTWKTEPVLGEENLPDTSATKVFTCPVITNLEFEVQHSIICKAYVISKKLFPLFLYGK